MIITDVKKQKKNRDVLKVRAKNINEGLIVDIEIPMYKIFNFYIRQHTYIDEKKELMIYFCIDSKFKEVYAIKYNEELFEYIEQNFTTYLTMFEGFGIKTFVKTFINESLVEYKKVFDFDDSVLCLVGNTFNVDVYNIESKKHLIGKIYKSGSCYIRQYSKEWEF